MALKLETIGGFGTGALGDVAEDIYAANLNSYAHVTAIGSNSITIDDATAIHGSYEDFAEGTEILFHVSTSNASNTADYLGRFLVAKITSVTDNVLVVDKNITDLIPNDEFPKYNCQVVTVAQFKNLTLNEGIRIQPIAYSDTSFVGGIVALKCSEALNFAGGHIDVADRGISLNRGNLRPLTAQETNGIYDADTYSAWENSQAKFCLPLNTGDGLVFLAVKKISCNENSRIGNAAARGQQFIRGTGSNNIGGGTPRQGGSSIFLVANEIENFLPDIIAKYRTGNEGRGLGRCYIASKTILRNDEGLYAFEIISDPARAMTRMNIKDFGKGSLGTATNITVQVNNYAKVVKISDDRKILTYANKTSDGVAPITRGALVMVHICHMSNTLGLDKSGRFVLAKVLADNGTDLTLDTAVPNVNLEENYVQIISVAQYDNFTLSTVNEATPQWTSANGYGGIFAIAVKNHCDLSGGKIGVIGKGTTNAQIYYGREGLATIGNNQDCDKLPLGQGNGSVFILAKELTMDENTRIGSLQSGKQHGGRHGNTNLTKFRVYPAIYEGTLGADSGYVGAGLDVTHVGGSGQDGGFRLTTASDNLSYVRIHDGGGGYGSNGKQKSGVPYAGWGKQGAHVMIVADTINNFTLAAISTGGMKASLPQLYSTSAELWFLMQGGAGYGGSGAYGNGSSNCGASGGYNGGGVANTDSKYGGGSSGWAFIYCNNVVNQSTDGIII